MAPKLHLPTCPNRQCKLSSDLGALSIQLVATVGPQLCHVRSGLPCLMGCIHFLRLSSPVCLHVPTKAPPPFHGHCRQPQGVGSLQSGWRCSLECQLDSAAAQPLYGAPPLLHNTKGHSLHDLFYSPEHLAVQGVALHFFHAPYGLLTQVQNYHKLHWLH